MTSGRKRVPFAGDVTATIVPADRREALANLMQLYLHDFSEFAPVSSKFGEVDAHGRFFYGHLDSYWQDEDRTPLFIEASGRTAGFALLRQSSVLDMPIDRSVAEFFILRKYRRAGVGSRAASHLFARFPGKWEVPVASYNKPALAFWRKAVSSAIERKPQEFERNDEKWRGMVLRFESRPI